jgi:DNA-binding XRE family transcriptional regulator
VSSSIGELTAKRARLDAEIEELLASYTDEVNERFGRNLKWARARRGLSQGALAAQIGLTRTSVTNIEAGRQAPSWATAVLIAQVLDLAIGVFCAEPPEEG